jgi:putative ABC transport system permease protein
VRRRPLATALNVLLLALGLATIVVVLLFGRQARQKLTANAQGIDAVVGAKGSPLQLVLSSVYHLDAPTGNIRVSAAEAIARHPMVAQAIPLALGDSYRGHRIVGADTSYAGHYGAALAGGRWYAQTYDAVVGAQVATEQGLAVGSEIVSAHGLSGGGQRHGEAPLRVAGVLAPSGTVLDRLVLTSVETVWAVHGDHGAEGHDDHADETHDDAHDEDEMTSTPDVPGRDVPPRATPDPTAALGPGGMGAQGGAARAAEREYTALLVRYRSPMAAALFPRFVNGQTELMAASPAFETARLFNLVGVGVGVLRAFSGVLIVAAALGFFIALTNAMRERRYDLAVMRALGASRTLLVRHVLLEGLMLAALGLGLGLVLGHAATSVLAASAQAVGLTGWTWAPAEAWLVVVALGVGLASALVPAAQAYRTEPATTLARG